MALGHVEVRGSDGVMRQVITYNSEQDVPANWRSEAGGTNLAFTNPVGLTTDPASAKPGVDCSLIYDAIAEQSTVGDRSFRVVVPSQAGNKVFGAGETPTLLDFGIITAIVIIAICVTVIASILMLTNFFGKKTAVAAAVANGGKTEWEKEVDVDGDGIPDAYIIKYNNGQMVTGAYNQAGVAAGYSTQPSVQVDAAYKPEDITDIFNSGFWGQIGTVIKYAVVGGAALGLLYLGAKLYSSHKTKTPFRAPLFENAGAAMGQIGTQASAKFLGA